MTTTVSRWVEFDAGHRVPQHDGHCRRPHGHRYRVTVTCEGGVAPDGMVIDFGILSLLLNRHVHGPWDHRFLIDIDDTAMALALEEVDPECLVLIPGPPTAETLAEVAGVAIADDLPDGLTLIRVDVRETPKSVASWSP